MVNRIGQRGKTLEEFQHRIGHHIAVKRSEHKLTQKEVAQALHCDASLISKWEHGKVLPQLEDIRALAILFQCSFDELLGNEPQHQIDTLSESQVHPYFAYTPRPSLMRAAEEERDTERGLMVFRACLEGASLEELYTLPDMARYKGNPNAIFSLLHAVVISGNITITSVPRNTHLETQIVKRYPFLEGSVCVVDLPEKMVVEVLPPEFVGWAAAHYIVSQISSPSVVGLGYSCTINRMCQHIAPTTRQFNGTHWTPLITYQEHEASNVYAANYLAALMKQRHHKSIAQYLPYIPQEDGVFNAQMEHIRQKWETLDVAFVGGWGWSADHNDHLPESHRLRISQFKHMGSIKRLVGEFLGHFLDSDGHILDQDIPQHYGGSTNHIPLDLIAACVERTGKVYFVGADKKKASLVRVLLERKYINGIVTDSSLAREL